MPNVAPNATIAMYIGDFIDWLHSGWRFRNQLLDGKRRMEIGGLLISSSVLRELRRESGEPFFSDTDLNPANKQEYLGMLKVCCGIGKLNKKFHHPSGYIWLT